MSHKKEYSDQFFALAQADARILRWHRIQIRRTIEVKNVTSLTDVPVILSNRSALWLQFLSRMRPHNYLFNVYEYTSMFFRNFPKGDNFPNFLISSLEDVALPKRGPILKERICS